MDHIGQYRILKKLGSGGMGTVLLGEHILLGRRAAIKTLRPELTPQSEIVERFFNEARATSAIADPGVVQVYDFGYSVDGTAYIVMELLEGEGLGARIQRLGRLHVPDVLRIARQVASSLASAHAREIVHRDLKPDNVFLIRDPEVEGGERAKIFDFGICKRLCDPLMTLPDTMLGTPVYMSPEQCRGACRVDHRADIYALGCVMYDMLVGEPPFSHDGLGEVIAAHMLSNPQPPSARVRAIPKLVDDLVMRCLEKSPDNRFQTMLEASAAIEQVGAELGPSSSQPHILVAGALDGLVTLGPGPAVTEIGVGAPEENIATCIFGASKSASQDGPLVEPAPVLVELDALDPQPATVIGVVPARATPAPQSTSGPLEVSEDIERWFDAEPAAAESSTSLAPARRTRWAVIAGVAVLALASIGGIVANRDERDDGADRAQPELAPIVQPARPSPVAEPPAPTPTPTAAPAAEPEILPGIEIDPPEPPSPVVARTEPHRAASAPARIAAPRTTVRPPLDAASFTRMGSLKLSPPGLTPPRSHILATQASMPRVPAYQPPVSRPGRPPAPLEMPRKQSVAPAPPPPPAPVTSPVRARSSAEDLYDTR